MELLIAILLLAAIVSAIQASIEWLQSTSHIWLPALGILLAVIVLLIILPPIIRIFQDLFDPAGIEKRKQRDAEVAAILQAREAAAEVRREQERLRRIELTAYRDPAMTGHQFEQWCARRLNALGWQAKVTQASGDQGCDVVAVKNGITVVIQCKLYAKAVGNKAVQEIFAAKHHYSAQVAVVVTSSSFTPAAITLANSTGVFLLHADDLPRMDRVLPTNPAASKA